MRFSELIKDKSFSSFIAKAQKAIEQEDIKKAKKNISAAKKADPERPELSSIEQKLNNLEKRIRIDSAITSAKSAADEDDWVTAKKFLEIALQDAPDNNEILNTLKTSNQIIKFKALFSIYVKDPYKLANEKNNKEIKVAIDQTKDISLLSKGLKKALEYLLFEGQRKGFKSKLVKVLIPIEQNSFSVKVICDEPI